MKIIKKISEKSKFEQVFILIAMCVVGFGMLCLTGCGGGNSPEIPYYGSVDEDGISAKGCSVPGLGGCFTPERGCMGMACWAQSCKYSCGTIVADENSKEDTKLDIVACDTRYYKGGCLGCGQEKKSCYVGCVSGMDGEKEINGIYIGNNENGWTEEFIGYSNGCQGCIETDNEWGAFTYGIEEAEGID